MAACARGSAPRPAAIRAVVLAMSAAILFGAVHALMPGHGKTVLVSYHLGQRARPVEGFVNGAIGGIALGTVLTRHRFMAFLARSETLRHRIGVSLEIGGALPCLLSAS